MITDHLYKTLSKFRAAKQRTADSPPQYRWLIVVDVGVLVAMGVILFWGTSTQFSNPYNDVTRYECYALAFWQGQAGLQAHALQATPRSQCTFLARSSSTALVGHFSRYRFLAILANLVKLQPSTQPFHTLPPEYPILTLALFSIPLITLLPWYQIVFSFLMTLLAATIYALLVKYQSRLIALVFVAYLVVGGWATTTDRFDLVPAGLTLGAVLLAGKARWTWAFALLALATLCKFYPVILLLPFLIAQQAQHRGERRAIAKRWWPLVIFICLNILLTAISLAFNAADTFMPFAYFLKRPFEMGSFPATLLWLGKQLGHPAHFVFTYQSNNIIGSLTRFISPLNLLLEIGGLLFILRLQWRGKLHIDEASLLTILVVLITGKVFSPQYLVWASPLIALVGKTNWRWLLTWGLICALTTFMFPLHYNNIEEINQFYPAIVARNVLILSMTCVLFHGYSKREMQSAPLEAFLPRKELAAIRVRAVLARRR